MPVVAEVQGTAMRSAMQQAVVAEVPTGTQVAGPQAVIKMQLTTTPVTL